MKGIDLRKEILTLLKDFGLNALYVRENKYVRCVCYNPLHRSGESSCKVCGGFGHLTAIESVRLIYDNDYYRNTEATNQGLGIVNEDKVTFYMDHKMQPKVKDRVYITSWLNKIPEEILRVYIITSVDEMRMDDGRIEGYTVVAKLRPDLVQNANSSLMALDYPAKIEIGKGGRHLWPYSSTPN